MAERGPIDSLPTSTLGQYRVLGRIGSGGMGDVYDAVHTTLDKRVAIKTLRRRFLDDEVVVARFLREGQLASRMRHPNIVDVTDVGVIDELPCLVMEHLEGETLGDVIRRDGAMAPSALVDILLPIIAAVDFAHDHGVLHRDLKPSNIFLARSWNGEVHPKVLDFGISKLVSESAEAALTADSSFLGTPHYASPESMRAEKAVDRRSDQYSMGVILYEGTTGVRPFAERGETFVTMALAICAGDCRAPRAHNPGLPEALERIIQRAMALHASDRFSGMRELGAALVPFASERARVIWAPSFKSDASAANGSSPQTQVLQSSGMTAVVLPQRTSNPSQRFSMGSAPSAPSAPWAPNSVRSQALSTGPVSGPPHPSSFQGRLAPNATGPYSPMLHDGTPSFGSGTNRSIHAEVPKRSSSALITALIAIVGVALISAIAARVLFKQRAPHDSDVPAAAASSVFTLDVHATPESAVFELDGAAVGSGHLSKQLPRDGQKHVLRISAAGFETLLVQFDDSRPPPALIALHEGGQPAPTTPSSASHAAPQQTNSGARPSFVPTKNKPERPRTDNIDPWQQ